MSELTDTLNYIAYINSLPFNTTVPTGTVGPNNVQTISGVFTGSYNALLGLIQNPDPINKATSLSTALQTMFAVPISSPQTWDQFITSLNSTLTSLSIPHNTATSAGLIPAFFQDFEDRIQVANDPGFDTLDPQPDQNQFKAFFGHFLRTLGALSNPYTATGMFFGTYGKELANVVSVSNDAVFVDYAGNVITPLPSFETYFKGVFPVATQENFEEFLTTFYQAQVTAKGYFVPSSDFTAFQQAVQTALSNPSLVALFSTATGPTLGSLNSRRLLVFNRVYALVASLLNTMQALTAAQASRLILLSQWQKAYTDSIAQLHTFLQGDGTPITDSAKRAQLNDFNNTNLRDLLRNNQQIVSDDAKALQSSVNQSNDAISQQANLATALIQELSGLLSAIFR